MQCVNCGLENIPGMQLCARCQSRLEFGAVAVAPPRASGLRLQNRLGRLWYAQSGLTQRALGSLGAGVRSALGDGRVPWSAVFLSIVPGLGHLVRGHRLVGRLILAGWGILIAASVVTLGAPSGWWFIMLTVSLHANAVLSLLGAIRSGLGLFGRMAMGIALFGGLYVGLYRPVGQLGAQVYAPLPLVGMMANSVLQDGDAVLFNGPWTRPDNFARGDLVVYEIKAAQLPQQGYLLAEGLGLDRVVGLPGDLVKLQDGQLLVNGVPPTADQAPLGPLGRLGSFELRVEADELVILPSSVKLNLHGNVTVGPIISLLSRIPLDQVLGRVVLRIQPWSRLGHVQ